jgi:hypothetical protein
MAAFLAVCAVGYGVAYEYESPLAYAWLILMAWLHFALSGVLVATACWALANKHMRAPNSLPHSVEQEVEWLYAWDVHCNSFVPILLLLYAGQYLALPLLMRDGLLPALAANILYAAAASHYVYITFSGYLGARCWAARRAPRGGGGGGGARCGRVAAPSTGWWGVAVSRLPARGGCHARAPPRSTPPHPQARPPSPAPFSRPATQFYRSWRAKTSSSCRSGSLGFWRWARRSSASTWRASPWGYSWLDQLARARAPRPSHSESMPVGPGPGPVGRSNRRARTIEF